MEDPAQPTQQASEISEADPADDPSDESVVSEVEGQAEPASTESAEGAEELEAPEEETEVSESGEETEAVQSEEEEAEEAETDEDASQEEEIETEEELDPFDELAHIDYDNEQFEGKEVYPEMFAPAQATNYEEFDSFFQPSYAEMTESLQNPVEEQEIDQQQAESSFPVEEVMPSLDTLEASNRAVDWINQAQEDEEPTIQVDPSLLTF